MKHALEAAIWSQKKTITPSFCFYLKEGDDFAKNLANNYFVDTLLELSKDDLDQIVKD